MPRKNLGFTLVELLITIALISVIGTIIVFSTVNINKATNKREYDRFIDKIISASRTYADMNPEAFNDLYVDKAFIYIEIKTLIEDGLLDEDLRNPYTKKRIDPSERVKVTLDELTGALKFIYPVSDDDVTEQSLIAMSDYVIPGEKLLCTSGLGSYMLSLYDENGDFIDLSNADERNKYNFNCSYKGSNEFKEDKPGNYEIEYTWTTLSGNNRKKMRSIRVLPPPTVSIDTNKNDLSENDGFVKPDYDGNTNTWSYLVFKPRIDGIDYNMLSFNIMVKDSVDTGSSEYIIGGTNNYVTWNDYLSMSPLKHRELAKDFTNSEMGLNDGYLPAYDGVYDYIINVQMQGHYDKNYYYKPDVIDVFTLKEELVLPSELIINQDPGNETNYKTQKNYKILKDSVFNIKNLKGFQYILDEPKNDGFKSMSSSEQTIDIKSTDLLADSVVIHDNIYFRIESKQQNTNHVNSWSNRKDLYITNKLSLLLTSGNEDIMDCKLGCLKEEGHCYFCSKSANNYISFYNEKMVALQVNDSGRIIATIDDLKHEFPTYKTKGYRANWFDRTIIATHPKNILKYNLLEYGKTMNDMMSSSRLVEVGNKDNKYRMYLPVLENFNKYKGAFYANESYILDSYVNDEIINDYKYVGVKTLKELNNWDIGYKTIISAPKELPDDLQESNEEGESTEDGSETDPPDENALSEETDDTQTEEENEIPKYLGFFTPYIVISNNTKTMDYTKEKVYLKVMLRFNDNVYITSGDGSIDTPYVIAK